MKEKKEAFLDKKKKKNIKTEDKKHPLTKDSYKLETK